MTFMFPGVLALLTLSACSSIIEGTSQEVMVNTNPSGAECSLERQGLSIARIDPTPGAASIKKTKNDMIIKCYKNGYQEATYLNHSGTAGATWGNIVAGGGIGWAVDFAAGADNKYESPVNITLVPNDAHPKTSASSHSKHVFSSSSAPGMIDANSSTPSTAKDVDGTSAAAKQWPSTK